MRGLLALLVFLSSVSMAAPESNLDPYWNEQGTASLPSVEGWQLFLDRYLVTRGQHTLVRYEQVTDTSKNALNEWISRQAAVNPKTLARDDQYAYWVNLYNALTVQVILDSYPVSSIRKLGWFNSGPWNQDIVTINQRSLSLNDIEHRILRPIFDDRRIHFVVNCAALGCPNLSPKALTADNLEQVLSNAELRFINSDKGVQQRADGWLVSSIFDWYLVDFANSESALIAYLNSYLNQPIPQQARINFEYDWQLNEAKQ